ncbi:MAG: 5'-methylthioadenosine/adenosylhomocysteine nucleosidase [Eggerthellaceae bacterium]|nr:5'-methylthioadenosine/adenosylhomocysteine nucleosidase [Eggerthellaceae bacterium]
MPNETKSEISRRDMLGLVAAGCAAIAGTSLAGCAAKAAGTPEKRGAIGIIGAMDPEIASLRDALEGEKQTTIAGMEFYEGTLDGTDVVVVQCGMGKVNAGICAHELVNTFGCTKIVNTGVAGSLDARIDIGDIVVSTDAVQHDFDVSYLGFAKGEIPYTGLYAFPADDELRSLAVQAAREAAPEIGVFEGRVCSGDQFISTVEQKDKITSSFGGMCCEMEGAAIAQACYLNDVPFVVIRVISDKPGGTELVDYQTFEAEAAAHCAAIVRHMVGRG